MKVPLILFSQGDAETDWTGFLDREARATGTLEVPGAFRFDGALRGRIVSRRVLVLGEAAEVEGEIEGERVAIYGRFRGTLRARERVEVHARAIVSGDLYTPCLILEPGARFDGHCYLQAPGEEAGPVLVPVRSSAPEEPAKA